MKSRSLRSPRLFCTWLLAAWLGSIGAPGQAAVDPKASRYYEDALTRYEKRDMDGAIIQLKNALQIDKNLLPVHVLLGKALLSTGEAPSAEAAFLEALRLGVNRAEVVLPLAHTMMLLGRQQELLDHPRFSTAGLPVPLQAQLLLVRSSAALDLGNSREALRAIEEARQLEPQSPASWTAEVQLRIRNRQVREAIAAGDKALSLAPKSAEALYQRGSIDHLTGNRDAALASYGRALAEDGRHVEARIARAGIYVDMGRAADARKDLEALQEVAPDEPRGAYLRGVLAERDGDQKAATAALREVTEAIDPVPVEYIRYRPQHLLLNGLAHFGLNEREKAKPYLELFQKVQGSSAVNKLLGRIYMAEQNYDSAVDALESYLKAQPSDPQALVLLANAHMARGRYARATTLMQEALRSRDAPEYYTVLGLSLVRSGQQETAIPNLEAAFKRDPTQVPAATALVLIHLRKNQTAQALAVIDSLLKRQPGNPVYLNLMGMAKAQRGDAAGARLAFDQALKVDPSLDDAVLNLAKLSISARKYDEAEAKVNELLRVNERHVDALMTMAAIAEKRGQRSETVRWLQKANDASSSRELRPAQALVDLYLHAGQTEAALEAAKNLLSKAPSEVDVLTTVARVHLANGDPASARTLLTNATRLANYDARRQVQIALLQMNANNLPGAAYSLDKALSEAPDMLEAQALLGEVELKQGELNRAEQRARQIAQKFPKRAVGHILLGDVMLARKQPERAVEAYRVAQQVEPGSENLLRLARATGSQGDNKAAIQMVEQWLRQHPKDHLVRKELAHAYVRTGNYVAAKGAYQELLKVDPRNPDAMNNLANVMLRLKDPGADKLAEQALAAHPAHAGIIDTAGWIALQSGQQDRALQLLRDARLRRPADPEIRYHLAAALVKTGRNAEAKEELEAALRTGVRFDGVTEAEALLRTLK